MARHSAIGIAAEAGAGGKKHTRTWPYGVVTISASPGCVPSGQTSEIDAASLPPEPAEEPGCGVASAAAASRLPPGRPFDDALRQGFFKSAALPPDSRTPWALLHEAWKAEPHSAQSVAGPCGPL